jgi:UDP-N-acetylglucosamine 2-epimerase (non-hydrolysing)
MKKQRQSRQFLLAIIAVLVSICVFHQSTVAYSYFSRPSVNWINLPTATFNRSSHLPSVLIIIGTRPEAIKMAPIVHELIKRGNRPTVAVTGQHPDLIAIFLSELKVQAHIYLTNVFQRNQSLGQLSARIIEASTIMFRSIQPDVVLIQGDTTSAFAVAYSAFLQQIPTIGHVEAGLRTYDLSSPFPEEMNRQAISKMANVHFAPTLTAVKCLQRDSISTGRIHHTGNTAIDSILHVITSNQFNQENIVQESTLISNEVKNIIHRSETTPFGVGNVTAPRIILLTTHRRENHNGGHSRIFQAALELCKIFDTLHFIVPLHPSPSVRTAASNILGNINTSNTGNGNKSNRCVHVIEPTGYFLTSILQKKSLIIMTDSGGIQEEAAALQKPVLVLREKTERVEGVKAGIAKVLGSKNVSFIVEETSKLLNNIDGSYDRMSKKTDCYGNGTAAIQIVNILLNKGRR